jgi:putative nucleotidyltransferase with HDIG domain
MAGLPAAPVDLALLRKRIDSLESIPSLPAILMPVLRHLEGPADQVDVHKVVDLVSHDKSLAAQVLHMANSPLYGQWTRVESIRSAVVTLGLARLREIVISCCMLNVTPKTKSRLDPTVFWEHSLACALVARRMAKKIGMPDPDKAYLAGLLHDIGIIANLLLVPEPFEQSILLAQKREIPIDWAENEVMGINHTITGDMLAEKWNLGDDLREVIRWHHEVEKATKYPALTAVVSLADLLCRVSQLGYGYDEERQVDFANEPGWGVLLTSFPQFADLDFARFTFELDGYVKEVRNLVSVLFRLQ